MELAWKLAVVQVLTGNMEDSAVQPAPALGNYPTTSNVEQPMNCSGSADWLAKIAFICGLFPFVAGISIFTAWCITGSEYFIPLGLFNIFIGVVLAVAGGFSLLVYWAPSQAGKGTSGLLAFSGFIMILLNFPLCASIVNAYERISRGEKAIVDLNRTIVQVVNASAESVKNVRLRFSDREVFVHEVPSNQSAIRELPTDSSGPLRCSALQGKKELTSEFRFSNSIRNPQDLIIVVGADQTLKLFSTSGLRPYAD